MASVSRDENGRKRILFVAADGKRKTIRLGKVSQRIADEVRAKVESLNAAAVAGLAWDGELAKWVAGLPSVLADKLAAVGLISRRRARDAATLGAFLDGYINGRTDVKPLTRRHLSDCKRRLVEFFGADKALAEITPADADAFLLFLRERYASGTAGRTVKRAKQFLRNAVRARLIAENPFADVKPPSEVNESRKFFVTREAAYKVLDACPDAEWRLLFALSRFGGLRCPSEHLALTWADVDWEKDRFRVVSSKLEHLDSGGVRWVPIFPELLPYLADAFEQAAEGALHVISRYRDANTNLRTHLCRIIRKAGLEAWPKLFHNLRASRETELAAEFPIHVVCSWIGHAAAIAQKHYLQVTDGDFQKAAKGGAKSGALPAQKAAQSPAGKDYQQLTKMEKAPENRGFVQGEAIPVIPGQMASMPLVGLEPTTR